MNQPQLKETVLNEIKLVDLLQLNKKDEMLLIAEKTGAQVKKSYTKAKIAEDLANQLRENFLEQLSYLRTKTMAVIETLAAQNNSATIALSKEQLTELTSLKDEGFLYMTKETDESLSISLARELKESINEIKSEKDKLDTLRTYQTLVDYSVALTHMYGVYHVDQLVKVWNSNQTKQLDVETISKKLARIVAKQPSFNWNGSIIYAHSFSNEEDARLFYDALQSRNIPYFMPTEKDLELYTDFIVNKQSPYYLNIQNFIHLKNYDKQTEANIMAEITKFVIFGTQPDKVYKPLSELGLLFTTEEEVITFVQLFQELSNQTRKWTHRGWTQDEIEGLKEKESTKKTPITVNKVGRNEPCPCGSGKKYKKCHGK